MSGLALALHKAAFGVPRDPRSNAYKLGCLAMLRFRAEGRRLETPFNPGTAESDAWHAGAAEGHAIWRRYRESGTPGMD